MRRTVEAVLVVNSHNHPHILVLQVSYIAGPSIQYPVTPVMETLQSHNLQGSC